jgi:transposase, IS30 family
MSHLTSEQRYTISVLLSQGMSQRFIASTLNRSPSVISREIKRNCDGRSGKYSADLAVRKCQSRHELKPKYRRLTDEMKAYIIAHLEDKLSPEQIVGISKLHGRDCVSHEWIYQMIWTNKRRNGKLHKHLRNIGKPYSKRGALKDKRGKIINRRDISERPRIVETRERLGDLEIDTIIGKNHKKAIVTINDRKTGVLKMGKVEIRNSQTVASKAIELLMPIKSLLHTITADNGTEFRDHETIANQLDIDFYFAKPYRSWERGSNENLNRLIRQYIPKGTDFDTITDEFIMFVQQKLNDRPRKRFGFKSPNMMFNQEIAFIS